MVNIVTYGTLNLGSDEVIRVSVSTGLSINTVETFNAFAITNPGVISPLKFRIETKIRKNSTVKYNNWMNEINLRPIKNLTVFKIIYSDCYFTSIDIVASELNIDGDLLWFDMNLEFIQNVNFS